MRKGEGIAAAGDILVGGEGVSCCPTFGTLIAFGSIDCVGEEFNVVAFLHTTDITYSIDIIRVREG